MKALHILKIIIRSAGYGVVFALVLLFLIPELIDKNFSPWQIFTQTNKTPAPLSYNQAVRLAGPAVVNIFSEEIESNKRFGQQPKRTTRLGSGVIMLEQGYILTNYHVVQSADLVIVMLQTGQRLHAELIGFDKQTDLAVLKVNEQNLPVIPQDASLQTQVGDVVLAIGNPLNLGQTVTQGIVSATGQSGLTTSYAQFLQMDAAINQGNSGGALVNSNGTLVGINSRKFTQANPNLNIQGVFFAVPYPLAHKIMLNIIEHGRVIRSWLGVSAENAPNNGFIITGITANSPALLAGLKTGDIVYQINDMAIQNINEGLEKIAETPPDTELILHISRNGENIKIKVTVRELRN